MGQSSCRQSTPQRAERPARPPKRTGQISLKLQGCRRLRTWSKPACPSGRLIQMSTSAFGPAHLAQRAERPASPSKRTGSESARQQCCRLAGMVPTPEPFLPACLMTQTRSLPHPLGQSNMKEKHTLRRGQRGLPGPPGARARCLRSSSAAGWPAPPPPLPGSFPACPWALSQAPAVVQRWLCMRVCGGDGWGAGILLPTMSCFRPHSGGLYKLSSSLYLVIADSMLGLLGCRCLKQLKRIIGDMSTASQMVFDDKMRTMAFV